MTKAQSKIVFNWVLVLPMLVIFSIFDEWILKHWETVMWPVLAVLFIIAAFSKNKTTSAPRLTRAEAHLEFNRIFEENPWIKIFYVAYGVVIAIIDYHAISNNINLLEKVGFFELLIAILILFFPIIVIKQKEAYIEAGKEN